MKLDPQTLMIILGMAAVTYLTRSFGFWLVGRFTLTGRLEAALRAVPGAVLVSLVTPIALARGPAETLASLITLGLAWKLPFLPAMLGGVAALVALRAAGL